LRLVLTDTAEALMPVPSTIRVIVVEDDRGTRDGLRLLIDRAEGFECIGTFGSAEAALAADSDRRPHVVLLDIQLPDMSGTDLVLRLRQRDPDVAILMLTAFSDNDKVFASICNGAHGYLLKNTPPGRLLEAIRDARAGGSPISPEIARKVLNAFRQLEPRPSGQSELKPSEIRLLALLAEGHSYETAGRELNVSINTIRSHIRSIYDTLHVHSKSEAVVKAMKSGIL
jgi:DNA-binding NarL/FixJ family response regulator